MNPRWKTALPVAAAFLIVALTLVPMGDLPPARGLSFEFDTWRGLADVLANVVLFLSLGVALAMASPRSAFIVAACAVYSLSIEVIQLAVPGRYSSLSDIIFNTLGAAAGVLIVRTRARWLHGGAETATLLGTAGLAVALAITLGGGYLLQPDIRAEAILYGQWMPPHPSMTPNKGRVLDAHTGSLRLPSRRIRRSAELRRAIMAGAPINVRFVAGPPVRGLSPIFTIYDETRNEMLLIGIDGDDAVLRVRARSRNLSLDQPDYRLPKAFAGITRGDTVNAEMWRAGDQYCLSVNGAAHCQPVHSPGWTWALLVYRSHHTAAAKTIESLTWLLLIFLPAGFWLRSRSLAWIIAVTTGLAILIGPRLLWDGPVLPAEALMAAAGIGAAFLMRRTIDGDRGARRGTRGKRETAVDCPACRIG